MSAHLSIRTPDGPAGTLSRSVDGYVFNCAAESYHPRALPGRAVSLTMPVRPQPYYASALHPIFQMNLPEGYLLERLRHAFAKSASMDPMLLLATMAGDAAIGRVFVDAAHAQVDEHHDPAGENLSALLSHAGAEGLFEHLFQKYFKRAALSGVQPKVLVPEQLPVDQKASFSTRELIVKSGLSEFPGLAINEYVCMSAVAGAGIPVPECFLSNDRKLFVMRRFDRRSDGRALGFEDMAVLMGLGADEKYSQSYEAIAHTIIQFTEGTHTLRSLHQLFDMVAVSCIVGNGDAHLKNFGLIYQAPDGQDATLAPAYDIVNTTCYIPDDALALTLGGAKGLYSAILRLTEFARTCRLPDKAAKLRIIEIAHAVRDTARDFRDLADEVSGLYPALRDSAERYLRTFEAQV